MENPFQTYLKGKDLDSDGVQGEGLTARAQDPDSAIPPIKKWLNKHGLPDLEITNAKDMDMIELWDDRCVQVIPNTGNPVGPTPDPTELRLKIFVTFKLKMIIRIFIMNWWGKSLVQVLVYWAVPWEHWSVLL